MLPEPDAGRQAVLVTRARKQGQEKIGIAGVEGNGQSELAAVLSGMLAPTGGTFHVLDVNLTEVGPKAVTDAGMLTVKSGSRTATRQAAFLSPQAIFICVFASAISAND